MARSTPARKNDVIDLVAGFSTLMQSEVAEQDSGPDPGDESSQTSFPEDYELKVMVLLVTAS